MYIKRKAKLTENGNFRLFAANGRRKRHTSMCFLQTENRKRKFVFLGQKTKEWLSTFAVSANVPIFAVMSLLTTSDLLNVILEATLFCIGLGWTGHLPWVILGICDATKYDSGLSSAELQ
jgi:hypothetical protein